MAGRSNPRRSGALEKEIVACLAASRVPLTPAEVQAELGESLAYTTVLTTLTRLHAKQAVVREPRGRAYAYSLNGTRAESEAGLTAHQMQKLLHEGVDRASVLSRFVDTLDEDSSRILRDLLDRS
ncbi:BlaI/MecI/CopY family transcriptional regulator [Kineosporia succinea]|uniref:Transcriptional regulator n=1 Tax=Kineosporia succinea TaxID=84632 RepID=A0ABT9PBL8_9ACTN|nr:BlaI/MecI/CopY family transcriptional regulator [Kineosporia succinea]MDP9830104.1 putative transcriptional regulator [Kineosporia succinea]